MPNNQITIPIAPEDLSSKSQVLNSCETQIQHPRSPAAGTANHHPLNLRSWTTICTENFRHVPSFFNRSHNFGIPFISGRLGLPSGGGGAISEPGWFGKRHLKNFLSPRFTHEFFILFFNAIPAREVKVPSLICQRGSWDVERWRQNPTPHPPGLLQEHPKIGTSTNWIKLEHQCLQPEIWKICFTVPPPQKKRSHLRRSIKRLQVGTALARQTWNDTFWKRRLPL